MKKKYFFLLLLCIYNCEAIKVVKPVSLGGDKNYKEKKKDKESSKDSIKKIKLELMSQTPENNCVNFNSKEIILKFNRKILLDTSKVYVSGGEKNDFQFSTSGDILKIIPNNLKQNTTYQINCTNAIKDFDEGYCDNVIVLFSTGSELNKGCVSGNVINLMTNEPVTNCVVALYKSEEKPKNIINSDTPIYFVKTNNEGKYSLNHISNGKYFLCAGECEKGTLQCDSKNNKYGFWKDDIEINDKEIEVDLDILKCNIEDFKLIKTTTDGNKYILEFNQPIKKIDSITTYVKSQSLINALKTYDISEDRCKLTFNHAAFNNMLPDIDNLNCNIIVYNDFDTQLVCDFKITFSSKHQDKQKQDKYTIEIKHKEKFLTINSYIDFDIVCNKDIERIVEDNIVLYIKNKLDAKYIIDKKFYSIKYGKNKHSIHIKTQQSISNVLKTIISNSNLDLSNMIAQDINVELIIKKNAIVLSDREETTEKTFNFTYAKHFGDIKGHIYADKMHFKIQLLNNNFAIIDTISDINKFNFQNVKEGKYKLRVMSWPITQHNWSCGNINYKQPHDIVKFYDKEIDVTENSTIDNINIFVSTTQ